MPNHADVSLESLDFDAFYRVEGTPGVAWRIRPLMVTGECEGHEDPEHPEGGYYCDELGYGCLEEHVCQTYVIGVMIGDDRRHEIEITELVVIPDDAFCRECGQIGCGHNAYE